MPNRVSEMHRSSASDITALACDRVDNDDIARTSTATRWPLATKKFPNASMNVLLPAPGGPERPIRKVGLARGLSPLPPSGVGATWLWVWMSESATSCCPICRCTGCRDSAGCRRAAVRTRSVSVRHGWSLECTTNEISFFVKARSRMDQDGGWHGRDLTQGDRPSKCSSIPIDKPGSGPHEPLAAGCHDHFPARTIGQTM